MKNIIICDDEKEIVDAVSVYMQSEGFNVFKCYKGSDVEVILSNNTIDLIILDIMMPEQDGITTLFNIRNNKHNIPIILLSAKAENNDKILGLNAGADDYITKPFDPLELVARVKSLLRRYEALSNVNSSANKIVVGDLIINLQTKQVIANGETVKLTTTEYDILVLLATHLGQTFSIHEIYQQIWHQDTIGIENIIAVHIRHIREKIEINPKDPKYIKVVWGLGYKIDKM